MSQIDRTDAYPAKLEQSPWIRTDDGRVAATAYFRDPEELCDCKDEEDEEEEEEEEFMANKPPIGDRLWLQMADFRYKERFLKIPLNIDDGTPWVEGICYPAMG